MPEPEPKSCPSPAEFAAQLATIFHQPVADIDQIEAVANRRPEQLPAYVPAILNLIAEVRRLRSSLRNLLESDAYCHGEGCITIGAFDEPAVIAAWAALSDSSHKGDSSNART